MLTDRDLNKGGLKRYMKTRRFLLAVVAIMCLVVASLSAFAGLAATGVAVSVVAPVSIAQDTSFSASINVNQVTNFDAANYDITYDPAVLEVTGVGNGIVGGATIPVDMWAVIAPGTIRVINNASGLVGVNGSGFLAVIRFHVIGAAGNTSWINLLNGVLSGNAANNIPATWTGQLVRVSSPAPTPTPAPYMWAKSIDFAWRNPVLLLTINLVDPAPVSNAKVDLELKKNGVAVSRFTLNTNRQGQASFSYRYATNGVYSATILRVTQNKHVWDPSKGVVSNSYTLKK